MPSRSAGRVNTWLLYENDTHISPGKPRPLNVDVIIIHSEDKNHGKWPLGIMEELFEGQDGKVRAVT